MSQSTVFGEMPNLGLGAYSDTIVGNAIEGWRSTIDATLGFYDASFTLRGSKDYLEEWYYNGLGRQVTRYAPDGQFTIWQGFVNSMTLYEPGLRSMTTMTGLTNAVKIQFAGVTASTNPPTTAIAPSVTASALDSDSILRYGTHEEFINLGQTTCALALQKQTQHLQRQAWPVSDDTYGDTQNDLRLDFDCLGWVHSLNWRVYDQVTSSGSQNASTEVGDILTAVAEFIDTVVTDTNTTQIPMHHQDHLTALDLLKAIASVGDASNNRWIIPVLENRTLYYKQAATQVGYYRRLADNKMAVQDGSGRILPPWEVRPDRWLRITDLYPFRASDPTSLQKDPQVKYIERVTYSEPWGLALYGSQRGTVQANSAALAALGVTVV